MAKKQYRDPPSAQLFLMPPSLRDWVPDGHPALFVWDVVSDLDLSEIEDVIHAKDPRGTRPFAPQTMLSMQFYAYMRGVFSSRKIARMCIEDVGMRVLALNQAPHFTVIARFRREHRGAMEGLFLQILKLCQVAGLVDGQHLYLDGTKLQANASHHKSMSYERMLAADERLRREISELLERADEVDADEDEEYGEGLDESDRVVDEVKRRETRLEWIRKKRAELEEEARKARAAVLREQADVQAQKASKTPDTTEAKRCRTRAAKSRAQADELAPEPQEPAPETSTALPKHRVQHTPEGLPKPKTQWNFTDPDSRIMQDNRGGWMQGYNGQVIVDDKASIIVAPGLSNQAPDSQYFPALVDRAADNLDQPMATVTADAGYFAADNVEAAAKHQVTPFLALKRQRRRWPRQPAQHGPAPPPYTSKANMAWWLQSELGTELMRRRKYKVEPVFGTIKEPMGFRRFSMRGLDKAGAEWTLVCAVHNLRKLYTASRRS